MWIVSNIPCENVQDKIYFNWKASSCYNSYVCDLLYSDTQNMSYYLVQGKEVIEQSKILYNVHVMLDK